MHVRAYAVLRVFHVHTMIANAIMPIQDHAARNFGRAGHHVNDYLCLRMNL